MKLIVTIALVPVPIHIVFQVRRIGSGYQMWGLQLRLISEFRGTV